MSHWYEDNSLSIARAPLVRLNRLVCAERGQRNQRPSDGIDHPLVGEIEFTMKINSP